MLASLPCRCTTAVAERAHRHSYSSQTEGNNQNGGLLMREADHPGCAHPPRNFAAGVSLDRTLEQFARKLGIASLLLKDGPWLEHVRSCRAGGVCPHALHRDASRISCLCVSCTAECYMPALHQPGPLSGRQTASHKLLDSRVLGCQQHKCICRWSPSLAVALQLSVCSRVRCPQQAYADNARSAMPLSNRPQKIPNTAVAT